MAHALTPSIVMYARLKAFGISNREAAHCLLNTTLTFDGRMLSDRIDESSQLSRRIVRTRPGDIPRGLFNSFAFSCPQLWRRATEKQALVRHHGNAQAAQAAIAQELAGPGAEAMTQALRACDIDDALYHNMCAYIAHADLPREEDRGLLHLMLFVVTGCLGNPKAASVIVTDYAESVLGADFHTAQSVISMAAQASDPTADILLGLVRVVDGRIKAGSRMHVLSPEGTELGLLPDAHHTVADVDEDVSRSHARIWRKDGRWYLQDLGSTNGTRVISGADGHETSVGAAPSAPTEIAPTDIICLGATTRFIVMPMLES